MRIYVMPASRESFAQPPGSGPASRNPIVTANSGVHRESGKMGAV